MNSQGIRNLFFALLTGVLMVSAGNCTARTASAALADPIVATGGDAGETEGIEAPSDAAAVPEESAGQGEEAGHGEETRTEAGDKDPAQEENPQNTPLPTTADKSTQTESPSPQKSKGEGKAKDGEEQDDKININTASAEELAEVLIGIGPKKAEAIVDYREKHGEFNSVDQLQEVKGIGPSTMARNRDLIKI